ncbi:MAG: ATP-binding protein, partial [Bacteroidota bacterium]
LKRENVELNELIIPVLENCRSNSGKVFSVRTKLAADVGKVHADPVHLSNIIYNLLDNASKYGGEDPAIVVETYCENRSVILKISDNGPGIPHSFQKKVFRKFFRIPTGNVHDIKGFGLGLFYVRNTCKAHGWKISLKSEPAKGCSFVISMTR